MTMLHAREHLQYACCVMAAVAFVLVLLRRRARSVEWRVLLMEIPIFLVTLIACVEAYEYFRAPADLLIALLLVEAGVFARVFDARRTYRSEIGTMRDLGNLYILSGLACALSHFAGLPAYWWILPVALFSCGYFFFRSRRGAANLCKGVGVLITVGLVASILYDLKQGGPAARGVGPAGHGLLPELIRPSFVEQLNGMNERIASLQNDRRRLTDDLLRLRADQAGFEAKAEKEAASRRELERKAEALEKASAAAEETIRRLKAESEQAQAAAKKESDARAAAEGRLVELEKTKAAAKESFSDIDEKLKLAADDLKKAVAERDGLKAELAALKAASPAPGTPAAGTELQALAQQVREKEGQRAKLASELARLQETMDKVREAVAGAPPATEGTGK